MKKVVLASMIMIGALNANVVEIALDAGYCNGEGHKVSMSDNARALLVKYEKSGSDLVLEKALKSGYCNGEGHSTERNTIASNAKLSNSTCPIEEAMNASWSDEA
ncbi:hypothetical protein [Candidatus Sulfurimonas baltica]|uniref:DUF3718 domain-containing protein n=1 Tax=Candidatus Sulfurimonas baltica TaxID=2740404 RepID=A0A7S7LUG4_9BACT|nr:hypothetical protein [Candidatus Sulfurimonas baltica]QOY51520.1 hypothetical protein HUE88_10415 [Candidatus Sulfurimonas baltica]